MIPPHGGKLVDRVVINKREAVREKAISGEISNFTGISDPYEEPLNPEVIIESDKETVAESVDKIVKKLKELKYISSER